MIAGRRTRLLMTTDAVGGVWQYSMTLAAALATQGVETLLAVMGPGLTPTQHAAAAALPGVRVVETGLPLDWLADEAAVADAGRGIATLAADAHADLVQLNSPTLASRAHFAMPVVAVAHGCVATWWAAARRVPLDDQFAWHEAMMRGGLRAADLVVAPTASHAEAVQRSYALATRPVVVHNGRALPELADAATQPAALTAGRLWDEVKDATLLDRVAARVAVPFAAAGPTVGPHGERVALAHLDMLGMLEESALFARLAARPIFVSAARFEPFGLAVLEAAGFACPLVLADIASARELWDGAATFVQAGDEDGFVAAIEVFAADPAARERLGSAARARAERYGADAMATAMARHFAALIERRAAA